MLTADYNHNVHRKRQVMTRLLVFTGVFSIAVLVCYLDARFGWQFAAWLNGQASSPFSTVQTRTDNKDTEIKELKERVSVLEALVTDQSYELNQKINRL